MKKLFFVLLMFIGLAGFSSNAEARHYSRGNCHSYTRSYGGGYGYNYYAPRYRYRSSYYRPARHYYAPVRHYYSRDYGYCHRSYSRGYISRPRVFLSFGF